MEKIKSIAEKFYSKVSQYWHSIAIVFLFIITMGIAVWGIQDIQDSRAGHPEVQTATIVEKIYKRAVDDVMFVPVGGSGSTIAIDNSTSAKFIIKLALDNNAVVKVKVRKPQYESLDVGASVNFKRWVGRAGRIYQQSILASS